jgi:hypothetical protein
VHRPVSAPDKPKNTPTTTHRADHRPRRRLRNRGKLIAAVAVVAAAGLGGWSLAGVFRDKPAGDQPTTITTVAQDSAVGYETGLQFIASASGSVTGIKVAARTFRRAGSTAATAHLWTDSGVLLGTGTIHRTTSKRWRTAQLAKPVQLKKGQRYVVSYWSKANRSLPPTSATTITRTGPLSQISTRYRIGTGFPDLPGPVGDYPLDLNFVAASPPSTATPTPISSTTAPAHSTPPASSPPSAPGSSRNLKNCASVPSQCGYPDATNTGVPRGVTLRPSGSVAASHNGQVIDGLDITGEINVTADNVVVRNTRVTGGGDWVVIVRPGVDNLTIEDSELRTPPGTPQDIACVLNIGDAKPRIIRVNIHSCSAGVSSGGGIVQDSYIHDMAQKPGLSHDVGVASNGTGGMTITHNTIFNQLEQTAAIAFYQDFDVQRNNLVQDNLLAGGGYCLYGGKGDKGSTSSIRFINNRLSRKYNDNCGYYGVIASWSENDPGNVWSGNYWDDSLATVK